MSVPPAPAPGSPASPVFPPPPSSAIALPPAPPVPPRPCDSLKPHATPTAPTSATAIVRVLITLISGYRIMNAGLRQAPNLTPRPSNHPARPAGAMAQLPPSAQGSTTSGGDSNGALEADAERTDADGAAPTA